MSIYARFVCLLPEGVCAWEEQGKCNHDCNYGKYIKELDIKEISKVLIERKRNE